MAEQAAAPEKCDHAWASQHQPGHLLYWIRQCTICHEVDWDDLDTEIGKLAESGRLGTMAIIWRNEFRPHDVPGLSATMPPPGTIQITRVEEANGHYHVWYSPVPAVPAAPSGEDRIRNLSGCICGYTATITEGIVRSGPRADCPVHGDEDRIRGAMAEAQDHPGRIVRR